MNVMTASAAERRLARMPVTTLLAWSGDEIKKNRRNATKVQVRIFFKFTVTHPVRNATD